MNSFLNTRILALVLAGGKGSRLEVLTDQRAKPAMPFAGSFRLIDIPLSNLKHSSISDVWIVEQYQPHSLNEQLANGRPWDLDRTYGGMRVLPPYEGDGPSEGFAQGNAEAIYQHLHLLREFAPDLLLVLSSDQVYQLNYGTVVANHLACEAEVTMVTTTASEDASRYSVVQVDDDGWVTDFAYKPDEPQSNTIGAEIFIFNAEPLFDLLDELASENGDDRIGDYGDELLPRLVERGRVSAFSFDHYWRDVGTVASYWQAHMDLLGEAPKFVPDEPQWPILTRESQRMPAHIFASAHVDDSLIAPGCIVHGRVERSVLSPGVVIEAGATVRDSVLMQNVRIAADATVDCAILDQEVQVGQGATVGAAHSEMAAAKESEIVLIGRSVEVPAHATIESGVQIEAK